MISFYLETYVTDNSRFEKVVIIDPLRTSYIDAWIEIGFDAEFFFIGFIIIVLIIMTMVKLIVFFIVGNRVTQKRLIILTCFRVARWNKASEKSNFRCANNDLSEIKR